MKSALSVLTWGVLFLMMFPLASAQSSGKLTASNALRAIEGFTHWYVTDHTPGLLDSTASRFWPSQAPWNFCWPPDINHPYSYTATLLDNAETTISLDDRRANEAAKRLRSRVLKYLHKDGWHPQPKGLTGGCYERNGAVIQIREVCNRCSNFRKAPFDGVMVFLISPDN